MKGNIITSTRIIEKGKGLIIVRHKEEERQLRWGRAAITSTIVPHSFQIHQIMSRHCNADNSSVDLIFLFLPLKSEMLYNFIIKYYTYFLFSFPLFFNFSLPYRFIAYLYFSIVFLVIVSPVLQAVSGRYFFSPSIIRSCDSEPDCFWFFRRDEMNHDIKDSDLSLIIDDDKQFAIYSNSHCRRYIIEWSRVFHKYIHM